jgi:hypothetical protein
MEVLHDRAESSTENQANLSLHGHQPLLFKGQKFAILDLLLRNRGQWVPANVLAGVALQYSSRIFFLRREGYQIENKTERVGRKVHGAFRLIIACPGEPSELNGVH